MASPAEIAAVRKVLYDPERVRQSRTHLQSIDALMNLNPNARIDPKETRIVGGGPTWFVSGGISQGVREAVKRCHQLADLVREARRELAKVDFDPTDKRYLLAALDAQARTWDERGTVWAMTRKPVKADLARISGPQDEAFRNYKRVQQYIRKQ